MIDEACAGQGGLHPSSEVRFRFCGVDIVCHRTPWGVRLNCGSGSRCPTDGGRSVSTRKPRFGVSISRRRPHECDGSKNPARSLSPKKKRMKKK